MADEVKPYTREELDAGLSWTENGIWTRIPTEVVRRLFATARAGLADSERPSFDEILAALRAVSYDAAVGFLKDWKIQRDATRGVTATPTESARETTVEQLFPEVKAMKAKARAERRRQRVPPPSRERKPMADSPLAIALTDAAGLCESEARRTKAYPQTSDHWEQVALQLRAHAKAIGPLAAVPDCDPMRKGNEPCGACERCKARTDRIVRTLVTRVEDPR